jgi:RNA polymerase sigma factor (sigma-70 family)
MTFPETRFTLIERLARGGAEADWREFLNDYWGPVCRFARYRGRLSAADAEDIAAQVLEAIIRNRLLIRWTIERRAKLRTLICTVVRYLLANRSRVESGRERLVRDHAGELDRYLASAGAIEAEVPAEQVDAFNAAWAEDIVQAAVEGLLAEYASAGKADHFRVLYGRICEQLTMAEIAESLHISLSQVDGWFRQARKRLEEKLRELVMAHVGRYVPDGTIDVEFTAEWNSLAKYVQKHGGLEAAVYASYQSFSAEQRNHWIGKVRFDDPPPL